MIDKRGATVVDDLESVDPWRPSGTRLPPYASLALLNRLRNPSISWSPADSRISLMESRRNRIRP
jgi:hypothetical protein